MAINWGGAYGQAVETAVIDAVGRRYPLLPPYATAEIVNWCLQRALRDQDGTLPPQTAAASALADYEASR